MPGDGGVRVEQQGAQTGLLSSQATYLETGAKAESIAMDGGS